MGAIIATLTAPDGDPAVPRLRSGDVALIMSNGGFGGIHARLLAALS